MKNEERSINKAKKREMEGTEEREMENVDIDKYSNPGKAAVKSGTSFPMVVITHSLI
jgi:hypothetical protein